MQFNTTIQPSLAFQYIVLVSVILGALWLIGKAMVIGWKTLMKVDAAVENIPLILNLREELRLEDGKSLRLAVGEILKEVKPNGGSSLKDKVVGMSDSLETYKRDRKDADKVVNGRLDLLDRNVGDLLGIAGSGRKNDTTAPTP